MSRLRIGIDLCHARADTAWQAQVQAAVALAPDIDFHLFVSQAAAWVDDDPAGRLPQVRRVALAPAGTLRHGWRLPQLQRRFALDLLHLPGLPALPLPAAWAGSLHDAPASAWQVRRTAAARLLCVPSRWARDTLVEQHGLDPSRIVVIPPGVDGARFHPGPQGQALVHALGLEPGGYICCIARRDAVELPLSLLEALACMPRPRPALVLIGRDDDPTHRRALDATVQRLGLEAEVRCLDQVSDTQLPALLRHARLFVQPSLQAQRGTAVLEAMASGVAVVVSEAPVLVERVGRAGLTVNPRDPHELAAAVLCLLADPRRREALVQRGLEHAAAHHWRAGAAALVEGWRHAVRRPATAALHAWA
jgi:glycosyltransferase involved in cell wall biosynthesis